MFSQRFTVSTSLNSKAANDLPMRFTNRMTAVGRSSLIREITLTDVDSGVVLATTLQKLVNMNKATLRSEPLSPEVLAFYDAIADNEAHQIYEEVRPPKADPSIRIFSMERKVRHSDISHMDLLPHTNQGTYMRLCLDCASEAIAAGYLPAFKDDICFYDASMAATIHLAESFAGDILSVHTWQDSGDPNHLHFTVTKRVDGTSQIIYYSFIEFYQRSSDH